MSVNYGGPGYKPYYGPTGKVDFNWISESLRLFGRSWWIWVLSALIYFVFLIAVIVPFEVSFVTSMTANRMPAPTAFNSNPFAVFSGVPWYWIGILYVGSILISLFMSSSFLHLAMKVVRHETVSFGDAFGGFPLMGRLFVLMLLPGIVGVLLSFLPLMMPTSIQPFVSIGSSILSLLFSAVIYPFLMVAPGMIADGAGPIQAITGSISVMRRNFGMAFLFILATGLILCLCSLLTCYLGFLVTMPMGYIIAILAYRDLVGMEGILNPNPGGYQPPIINQPLPQPGVRPPPPGQ